MHKDNGWELGQNWIGVALIAVSLAAALYFHQERKYEQLKMERNSLMAEMTPAQIRRAHRDLSEYYDAKSRYGDTEH